MWPQRFWKHVYEPLIRRAAGLGNAPEGRDPDAYEHIHVHCDVLVVGGGVAGLAAAEAAAAPARRLSWPMRIRASAALPIFPAARLMASRNGLGRREGPSLAAAENVHVLPRTTAVGHWHHNYLMLFERVADHDPALLREGAPRHRLWKVRAKQVILATGAIERPIAFANNDRPGIMLASAARAMVERYGVAPGVEGVVFTNNDDAYQTALALKAAGIGVPGCRFAGPGEGALVEKARAAGIDVAVSSVVSAVEGNLGCHRRCALRPIARAKAGSSPSGKSPAISSPCRAALIRHFICGATMAARSTSTRPAVLPARPASGSDHRGRRRQRHLCAGRLLAEAYAAGETAAKRKSQGGQGQSCPRPSRMCRGLWSPLVLAGHGQV